MKKNKFIKGNQIITMTALMIHLKKGRFIYLNHKPLHPGFIVGMSLRTLLNALKNKVLFTAKENK